eukprot:TRINITY_DN107825_c0_g1_i1.p1 TRINITY_DN107825_c0_g1~~TRINITY_DN107825_c0_g1_i1.p1  ORF type:complete len:266 (-),score=22.20 TRINITY_DN107825_c0_g1_i1:41-838(-)
MAGTDSDTDSATDSVDPTLFLPSDETPGNWVLPEGYTFKVKESIIAETGTSQLDSITAVQDGILAASKALLEFLLKTTGTPKLPEMPAGIEYMNDQGQFGRLRAHCGGVHWTRNINTATLTEVHSKMRELCRQRSAHAEEHSVRIQCDFFYVPHVHRQRNGRYTGMIMYDFRTKHLSAGTFPDETTALREARRLQQYLQARTGDIELTSDILRQLLPNFRRNRSKLQEKGFLKPTTDAAIPRNRNSRRGHRARGGRGRGRIGRGS